MKYIWATATHQGMVRQNNEDSVFPDNSGESEGPAVLMVADGMGGHVAGEVASRLAINAAASNDLEPADRVAAGNRAIREEVSREPSLEGMGTTSGLSRAGGNSAIRSCGRQPGVPVSRGRPVSDHRRPHRGQ